MIASHPQRVASSPAPWPLFDTACTRAIEARSLAATAPHALMARAGLATARLALAVAPHARRITVLAGPGNNGGDGLIAALHLQRRGVAVQVCHLADPARLPADAADAWLQAREAGLPITTDLAALDGAELVIDALLGLGSTRAPGGAIAQAVAAANACAAPVLAIDLPTGLDADHGCTLGDAAVRARWTLSLLTLKPGLFTADGRDLAGEAWLDDLGVRADEPPTAWLGAAVAPPPGSFAPRRHAQHKGSFGDVIVVGGAAGMAGAATLAARAALSAGGGRLYVSTLDPQAPPPQPELMQRPRAWEAEPAVLSTATVVAGCGGGSVIAEALPALCAHAARLVLDADALNAVAREPALRAAVAARGARGAGTIVTPHPLEAARLLGIGTAEVQRGRLAAAQRLADELRAVVVLKGSGTLVATSVAAPWINGSGNAALAAPGSGDVLAGWIGGCWAQLPSDPLDNGARAARAAVWLHGRAADLSLARGQAPGHLPLRAGDLIDAMAAVLR